MTYLWCLHGNLQTPAVWAELKRELESPTLTFKLENLAASLPPQFEDAFKVWTNDFCSRVEALPNAKHVLLGYSLGGRLGFHALLECPQLWTGAIIIAADPGLPNEKAKTKQLAHDQAWAQRWLEGDWNDLWRDWNAQGIFAGRENMAQPSEAELSRGKISQTFDSFSKGRQADLRPRLAQLDTLPILYVSGENDNKYNDLGIELTVLCPKLIHKTVLDAAHRVPWENPAEFIELVKNFLKQIEAQAHAF